MTTISNHQPHGCLLNRLFRRRSKKTSKRRVTGLCVGNSPVPVNSPHKGPVTRKMFPFDDVIMHIQWNPSGKARDVSLKLQNLAHSMYHSLQIMCILPLMTGNFFWKATILGGLLRGVPLYVITVRDWKWIWYQLLWFHKLLNHSLASMVGSGISNYILQTTTGCDYLFQLIFASKRGPWHSHSLHMRHFLAATKQLYEWFSPSVRPSVCLSVCHTFFTMFPSSYRIIMKFSGLIIYQWQKWCPCKRSRPEVKGQCHRGLNHT